VPQWSLVILGLRNRSAVASHSSTTRPRRSIRKTAPNRPSRYQAAHACSNEGKFCPSRLGLPRTAKCIAIASPGCRSVSRAGSQLRMRLRSRLELRERHVRRGRLELDLLPQSAVSTIAGERRILGSRIWRRPVNMGCLAVGVQAFGVPFLKASVQVGVGSARLMALTAFCVVSSR
jgi:hypothetical protein